MAEQERTESAGHYEMLWDCEFCETKGLLAKTQRHCAECGGKQNPDKRYFPKEGEEQKIDGHKYEGADKHCPNCEAPMGKLAHNCTNCGAAQDGAREVKGVATPVAPPKKKSRLWILFVVIGIVAIVGIIFGVRYCNRTESKAVTVAAHRWEMSIGVEEYGNERKSDWDDHVPRNAELSTCVTKQRTTKKIPDGEDCKIEKVDKKDGTFEKVKKCTPKYRSEPVDGRWCSYTVREWKEVNRIRSSGTGMTAAWPSSGLPSEQYSETLGSKRRGSKKATYFIDMTGLESKQTCEVSEAVWKKHADNAKLTVEVRSRSGEVVCDSL